MSTKIASYGAWKSPISAESVAQGGMSSRGAIRDTFVAEGAIYWRQLRGEQDGRYDLMRAEPGEEPTSILPAEFSANTRVHEYGGGAFFVHAGSVFFSNDQDQRLYRLDDPMDPIAITPEPERPKALRYADGRGLPGGDYLVCVQEEHQSEGMPINRLVLIASDGSQPPSVLAEGHDFYSSPRFSHSGDQILFLTWDHPNMPWDGTELWLADFSPEKGLTNTVRLAGGPDESIFQPQWGPDGAVYFISDKSGWWNLYRWQDDQITNLWPTEADLGTPAWNFGFSRYAFLAGGKIACLYTKEGVDYLAQIDSENGQIDQFDLPFTAFYMPYLRSDGQSQLWFVASSPTQPQALYRYQIDQAALHPVTQPAGPDLQLEDISQLQTITFPTGGDDQAHAFLYPPANADYDAPAGELPPLIVMTHGGPTAAAIPQFHLEKLFWTSRGFMVADINYRGSTGFGRSYRDRLKGNWGILDVEDCVHLARYLASHGHVDPDRLIIRGSSAGGYATLAAITFFDDFDAGASYYGVADIETLAQHTHKFEAHYLDSMIGPYPEAKEEYRKRSPIHHTEGLEAPLILLQGDEDKVVPPNQAHQMVQALEEKGVPYAYLEFEGEGHGFDRQSSVVRALTAELYFFSRVLGFELEEDIKPIKIHNLTEGSDFPIH